MAGLGRPRNTPIIPDSVVLNFLRKYIAQHGYAPSYREIAQGTGYATTSAVSYKLRKLQRDGKITRHAGMARTVTVRRSLAAD